MDLRLNAMRRSINLSVYFVFDLEAGKFKFLLGTGTVKRMLSTRLPLITCSNSERKTHQIAQICHFEPQKFCNE